MFFFGGGGGRSLRLMFVFRAVKVVLASITFLLGMSLLSRSYYDLLLFDIGPYGLP